MRAVFDDAPVVHDDDAIRKSRGLQSMCHQDRGSTARGVLHRRVHDGFGRQIRGTVTPEGGATV